VEESVEASHESQRYASQRSRHRPYWIPRFLLDRRLSNRRARSSARRQAVGAPNSGRLRCETGAPIDAAEVVDLFVDDVYRTQAAGLVGLWALTSRNDSVAVRIRKIGYADTSFVVMMAAGDTTPVQVYLRKAVTLPATVTDAPASIRSSIHLREFESRRHDPSLSGRFLAPEDLRKLSSKPINDVIHDLAAGKARGCLSGVRIFVDGIPLAAGDTSTLSRLTADDFAAAEFYTMVSTPLQYGGTVMTRSGRGISMGCGTVLLWRRETARP
jgi:hypothetical protein